MPLIPTFNIQVYFYDLGQTGRHIKFFLETLFLKKK